MTPRVVAIIQARMGSSRLPGKVLLAIEGEAMLARVVERTSRAKTVDAVLVATTTDPADDVVAAYCEACGLTLARGSLYDVLDRYYLAASSAKAEIVVRITADCPLIDPQLIDDVVCTLLGASRTALPPSTLAVPMNFDFAANRLPPPWKRTYPIGLDTEACTFAALERAWKDALEPQEREHVMPYLYEEVIMAPASTQLSVGISPRGFSIALLNHVADLGSHRWTVDTAEDLEFVREVYRHFDGRSDFSWLEVLELLRLEPRLLQINAYVRHKSLREVDPRARRADGLH